MNDKVKTTAEYFAGNENAYTPVDINGRIVKVPMGEHAEIMHTLHFDETNTKSYLQLVADRLEL